MGSKQRWPGALLALGLLAAWPARAQAPEQEQLRQQMAARYADGYAHLHGFGEGVASVLAATSPLKRSQTAQGFNGKVILKTYRQNGLELVTITGAGGGAAYPSTLTISRGGYQLPLGLHIGDARGIVEQALGLPAGAGDKLVIKRTQGEGCDDPITFSFRDSQLAQVVWEWQLCAE